jgi:hypothetical protein
VVALLLSVLHSELAMPVVRNFLKVEHEVSWSVDPLRPHSSFFDNKAQLLTKASGWPVPKTGAHALVSLRALFLTLFAHQIQREVSSFLYEFKGNLPRPSGHYLEVFVGCW